MLNNLIKGAAYGFLILLVSGCTMRTYSQVKDRVDQDMTGNRGYLMGTPRPEDRSAYKPTRKVYVLEMQSKEKEPAESAQTQARPKTSVEVSEEASARNMITVPTIEESSTEEAAESAASASAVQKSMAKESAARAAATPGEYTVEKGDTLQKISKKVYDTYRLWNKIYEANKEKIKDPNKIKPGTILTIPPR